MKTEILKHNSAVWDDPNYIALVKNDNIKGRKQIIIAHENNHTAIYQLSADNQLALFYSCLC